MGRTIAILTDFGYQDNYAGIMKGVIRTISPFADIIDINHGIPRGDIKIAAYNLESSYSYYPGNTIFLCVVDPGVGSSRRAIAVEADGRFLVAPDNGLLTPILKKSKVIQSVSLTNTKYHLNNPSNTFHGRDIFASVAAHISMKVELSELGELIDISSLVRLDNESIADTGDLEGHVIHNDIYGNLITDIPVEWTDKKKDPIFLVAGFEIIGLSETFSNVEPGSMLAYKGSSGYIEIAVHKGKASDLICKGSKVRIIFND